MFFIPAVASMLVFQTGESYDKCYVTISWHLNLENIFYYKIKGVVIHFALKDFIKPLTGFTFDGFCGKGCMFVCYSKYYNICFVTHSLKVIIFKISLSNSFNF